MLEMLCEQWAGPISLALYMTDDQLPQLLSYYNQSKIFKNRSNIGIHLVFKSGSLYPINHLRNIALNQVSTAFVFLLDGDFVPVQNSYQILRSFLSEYQIDPKKRKAIVIPAFEAIHTKFKMPNNKSELITKWNHNEISIFHSFWRPAHFATNYNRWRKSETPYRSSIIYFN